MRILANLIMAVFLASCVETTEVISSGSTSPQSNIFVTVTGFQVQNYGPSVAKGAIFYFGGHSVKRPTPMNDNIVQPYVLTLNKSGWDVFRANAPLKYRKNSSHDFLAKQMNALAAEAKRKGYKRVVFVGQSFGAWGIMLAAKEAQFDKFVAIAPATHGLRSGSSSSWHSKMLGIVPIGKNSKVPGVVFLFEDDEFYSPAIQSNVAAAIYANVTVVDRPDGFKGHGAAWLDGFDYNFGKCLSAFLSSNSRVFSCSKPKRDYGDHRWMVNRTHLEQGGAKPVEVASARSALGGNTLAGRAANSIINLYFVSETKVMVEARSGYNRGKTLKVPFALKGNKMCIGPKSFRKGCYTLYKWPNENLYFSVDEIGAIIFRGKILQGNPRNLK